MQIRQIIGPIVDVQGMRQTRSSNFYGMVEPIVLGIVIGLVCVSVAGLFVAAIGNWALSVRLMLLLTVCWFYTPRVIQN